MKTPPGLLNPLVHWKCLFASVLLLPLLARAQDLDLVGNTGWEKNGSHLRIHANEIINNRSAGVSGVLRLQIWATTNVYDGMSDLFGYVIGTYNVGKLKAGQEFLNRSKTVHYRPPPAGLYYTTITLEESTTSGFLITDSENFDGLVNFGGFGEGGVNVASVGDISFAGDVTWQSGDGHAQLFADQIRNERASGRSGSLRVRLWASATPYGGGTNVLSGYPMATQRVGRLYAMSNLQFYPRRTTFRPPPPGEYSVVLTLEEYDRGWNIVDYVNFDGTSLFSS